MGIFDGVKIDSNKNPLFSTSSSFFSKEDEKGVPPPVDFGKTSRMRDCWRR